MEVELPEGEAGESIEICDVAVTYDNLVTHSRDELTSHLLARFTDVAREVEESRNAKVSGSVARQRGALQNQEAMKLRDDGKVAESQALLKQNAFYLRENAQRYGNIHLEKDAQQNEEDAANLDEDNWKRQRKAMESKQLDQLRSLGYVE